MTAHVALYTRIAYSVLLWATVPKLELLACPQHSRIQLVHSAARS